MTAPLRSDARVYVSRRLPDAGMSELERSGCQLDVNPHERPPAREEFLSAAAGAHGVLTLLTELVDEELFARAGPQLKIVANCAVGYDNIDVAAASRHGVVVTNTPRVLDEATADLTMALILASARRLVEADRYVRQGNEWIWGPRMFLGLDVSAGSTLGIVGLGRIGTAVARRAAAFNMRLLATHVSASARGDADALDVEEVDLRTLLRSSDVVTLHCPLTPATRRLIGTDELKLMRSHAVLVNTARGPIVDEQALVHALERGVIGGAALDVYEAEPTVHPALLTLENVITLPHIASAGRATRDAMALLAVRNVVSVLSGDRPLSPVVVATAPA